MDLSSIPAPLIAVTLEQVGDSIENEWVNEKTGERGGHKYVVIDENNNSICAKFIDDESYFSGDQGVARFKTISKLVETALDSRDIKRENKIKMLEGYQKVTQRYEHKQQGWFTRMFAYFFGQGKEVTKAEALIKQGLDKYRPTDGFGKLECDGCTYEGEFKNGCLVNGTFTDGEGVIYKGHFNQHELLEGEGSITYPGGITRVGMFVEGKLDGAGKMLLDDFVTFSGEFKEGEILGPGKAFYKDGRVTESDYFIYGLTGDVKITDPTEKKITVGRMRNGILQDKVEITDLKENKVYIRYLKNGVKEASGRVILSDGSFYSGTFVDDKLNGQGMLSDREGTVLYVGILKNNEIHGRGVFYFDDKRKFEGNFKDRLNATGEMTDSAGITYKGKLINGLFKEYEIMAGDPTSVTHLEDSLDDEAKREIKIKQDKGSENEFSNDVNNWGEIPPPPNYSPSPPFTNADDVLPPDYPKYPPPPIPSGGKPQ